jgi:hypothetical protein
MLRPSAHRHSPALAGVGTTVPLSGGKHRATPEARVPPTASTQPRVASHIRISGSLPERVCLNLLSDRAAGLSRVATDVACRDG